MPEEYVDLFRWTIALTCLGLFISNLILAWRIKIHRQAINDILGLLGDLEKDLQNMFGIMGVQENKQDNTNSTRTMHD